MIKKNTFEFESNTDGLKISALIVEPENAEDIKGVIQLVHGMVEYKERYADFMEFLALNGYLCVIHDHRGHGKSVKSIDDLGYMYEGGKAGLIEDTHQVTGIIKEHAKELTKRDDLPFILLGHSMGSLVVRSYIKKYDEEVDKLCVLGCPSPQAGASAGLILIKLIKLFRGDKIHSKLIDDLVMNSRFEKRFKNENLLHAWVNSDREEVLKYNADPYCSFTFTINGYISLVELTLDTYSNKRYNITKPELPVKFFSGADDPCGISEKDIDKAIGIMKKAGFNNIDKKLYVGMRHEILNEPEHMIVYNDILDYVNQ